MNGNDYVIADTVFGFPVLGTKTQTGNITTVSHLIRDNMSSKNIPSVTQSLFHGHLS